MYSIPAHLTGETTQRIVRSDLVKQLACDPALQLWDRLFTRN